MRREEEPGWEIADAAAGRSGCLDGLDAAVKGFMDLRDVPGGSVALARHGRLVLARGYTRRVDATGPIQPTTRFRIASVSKPIAAVAVLLLAQEGRLPLDSGVYELLGCRLNPGPLGPEGADPRQITVLNLLQHQGGWDRGVSYDPHSIDRAIAGRFGVPLPISREDIVAYVVERPLDYQPGGRYAYSNFGYQLLGHLVEKVTGEGYVDWVQREILRPLGVASMSQGRTLAEHRQPNEATYHSSNPNRFGNVMVAGGSDSVPVQYGGYNLENMVTSGGWIATPTDLVRFAMQMAGENPVLDALHTDKLFAPPLANRWPSGGYYACGWAVEPKNDGAQFSHTGCLQGVTASLRIREDGIVFCALFNRREETSPFSWDIDTALNEAIDAVGDDAWPDVDHFIAPEVLSPVRGAS